MPELVKNSRFEDAFRQVQTSRRRLAMTRQAVGEISMPMLGLPTFSWVE
jgi:hypothetical protein